MSRFSEAGSEPVRKKVRATASAVRVEAVRAGALGGLSVDIGSSKKWLTLPITRPARAAFYQTGEDNHESHAIAGSGRMRCQLAASQNM